jgi:hypothetical protein
VAVPLEKPIEPDALEPLTLRIDAVLHTLVIFAKSAA